MESLLNLARVEFPSLPHWLLLAWVGVEPQCFPVGVAGIEQLLSKSFLSCQVAPCQVQDQAFSGRFFFFLSVAVCVSALPVSSAVRLYMKLEEN